MLQGSLWLLDEKEVTGLKDLLRCPWYILEEGWKEGSSGGTGQRTEGREIPDTYLEESAG